MRKNVILNIIVFVTVIIFVLYGYSMIEIESKIPQQTIDGIKIATEEFMSRKIFTILPENEKTENLILYFHGGAYMAEITENHWSFLENLAKDTKSTIIVPDYPLTPKYIYKDVLKMSEAVYKKTLDKVDNQNFILMGDSAGGGLVLGLEESLNYSNIEMPSKTILISPWLDVTMSNPKIVEVEPNDKKLNKFKLYIAGLLYSRGITESEKYFASPLNGELSNLKNVTIYTGTYDILNPDCYILKEKADRVGIDMKLKEYPTAPHIWIIDNNDNLSNQAYKELLQEIK